MTSEPGQNLIECIQSRHAFMGQKSELVNQYIVSSMLRPYMYCHVECVFHPIDSVVSVHVSGAPHLSVVLYLMVSSCTADGSAGVDQEGANTGGGKHGLSFTVFFLSLFTLVFLRCSPSFSSRESSAVPFPRQRRCRCCVQAFAHGSINRKLHDFICSVQM